MTAETTTASPTSARVPPQRDHFRELVVTELRDAITRLPESVRDCVSYHFGWQNEAGEPISAPSGKAIRPLLVGSCARAVGGRETAALQAAVAVELAHNFTLLHDDVMDRDSTRRHRPTVWTVFGDSAAILAGDALLMLATEILAAESSAAVPKLSTALLRLCDGQARDVAFEGRETVSVAECFAMAECKTAALLNCACELGALVGGGTTEQVRLLGSFGTQLGIAFQLVDDLLGIWGSPERTGKPVYSDLATRKKSLPVAAAMNADNAAAREFTELYARPTALSTAQLSTAAELVERAGGRAWALEQIAQRHRAALDYLAAANPEPRAAQDLHRLAELITARDH
ncbi:geranylgeranyl diphosphate synthase type I [Tamaricihabitans halophyticus]|uniref:Geranylgeranyl diphosphate synthase type I n=1 Tax=Tamaricihabitans halophyticus TaxID=1262583 RepID=A0A4R2QI70_9PSEU|nr:polyprenyl synthetase family protein [Tamaricihabitans halophyticus]TCP48469.1 geranylgeranyl diphosphate synthase type I [Tamaricihabitans halophyticus]